MLEVRLLGQFDVRLEGAAVEIGSRNAQSLLALLIQSAGTSHRREKLAGLFWPDTTEANARRSLRYALWQIRKAIEPRHADQPDYIVADDFTVSFKADAGFWLDVLVLDNKVSPECSVDELIRIVSVYTGDLLPGFYDEWAILERERLQVVYENKMRLLLERLVQEKRWEETIEWSERWIALGHVPEPAYRALMVAHSGLGNLSFAATAYQRCVDALRNELGVEPSEQTKTLYARLASGEKTPEMPAAPAPQKPTAELTPAPGAPPFKGLLYFDETDTDLFFGREQLTARLADCIHEQPFLAIVGASGSGKSSVARAGLVPALKHGADSAHWLTIVLTPTAHPLEALAACLTHDAGKNGSAAMAAALADDLIRDRHTLYQAVRGRLRATQTSNPAPGTTPHALIVVDQFEELFTLCRSEAERKSYIDNLLYAITLEAGGQVSVAITLRADFYSHCAQYEHLREALARYQEYIGPMNAEELRRAIEEPARRNGWTFEPGLVDLILRDVGDEPGALPLLSHALLETWVRRRGHTLTLTGYAESGGVRGAIAKTAETVYQHLTPDQQTAAREVFLRLTELGEGSSDEGLPLLDTRRRAMLAELLSQPGAETTVQAVLNILAEARLITVAEDSVEVAHEALIREWPTIRQWLAEDRVGLLLHRHLTTAARAWDELGRDPGELYRGTRLAQAREWVEGHADALNTLERAFLEASQAEANREARVHAEQRQQQLQTAQQLAATERQRAEEQARAANQLRRRALLLAVALVIASGLAVVTLVIGQQAGRNADAAQMSSKQALAQQATAEAERNQADQAASLAFSRELAAAAISNLDVDPERGILLALHAVALTDTLQAQDALHRAVQASRVRLSLTGHTGQVNDVAFSLDGGRIATASDDGTVKVWDASTGHERLTLARKGAAAQILHVAFNRDGTQVATVNQDGKNVTFVRWDLLSMQVLSATVVSTQPDHVQTVAVSGDWTRVAVGEQDGTLSVWDVVSNKELIHQKALANSIQGLAFDQDATHLATSSFDTTKVWDLLALAKEPLVLAGKGGVVLFSPDSTRLAIADADRVVKVWDLANGASRLLFTLFGHTNLIYGFAFNMDGTQLASASLDGTIKVWDVTPGAGRELYTLYGHVGGVNAAAFSPDGNQLVTAGIDGTARVWDASVEGSKEWINLVSHTGPIRHVVFSPDGQHLATGGQDGAGRVWDVLTGRNILTLTGHTGAVWNITYSPDGKRLATAGEDRLAIIWDAVTGQKLLTLSGHQDGIVGGLYRGVLSIAFSPDGKRLATAGADGAAIIWDGTNGRKLLTLRDVGRAPGVGVTNVTFSPDGEWIATASDDATVKVWNSVSGQELFVLPEGSQRVRVWGLTFSPDGKRLVTSGFGGITKVWEMPSGHQFTELSGHASTVISVVYSPDGTKLATASSDGTAKVWEAGTGQELLTLREQGSAVGVTGVSFSPDGKHLATSNLNGVVHVYLVQTADLVTLAHSRVTRDFTPAECQKYLHAEACSTVQ